MLLYCLTLILAPGRKEAMVFDPRYGRVQSIFRVVPCYVLRGFLLIGWGKFRGGRERILTGRRRLEVS